MFTDLVQPRFPTTKDTDFRDIFDPTNSPMFKRYEGGYSIFLILSIPNMLAKLTTVEQGKGEVLEITLPENFESIKVMDLKLPAKAVIGVVRRRNRVIIPNGITQLMSCDNLIVLTTSENAQLIKDYFKGKE